MCIVSRVSYFLLPCIISSELVFLLSLQSLIMPIFLYKLMHMQKEVEGLNKNTTDTFRFLLNHEHKISTQDLDVHHACLEERQLRANGHI